MEAILQQMQLRFRTFFSSVRWRNMLLFFAFFLVALSFWLMLFFQKEGIEGRYIIPIKYINVADNEVFVNPPPGFMEISLRDRGSNIFFNSFVRHDTLIVDVAEFAERGVTMLSGTELNNLVRQVFANGHNFIIHPPGISLELSKLQSKELMVEFDGEISTNRANLVVTDGVIFIPESVTAFGSQEALNQLRVAKTEFTNFRNLRATSQLPIRIQTIEGIRFVPDQVEIYIPVEEFTERAVDVPITVTNVPDNIGVKFFPSRVTVSFSVTLEAYRTITPEQLEIVLDYNDFYHNSNGRVALSLTNQPAAIVNPRLAPSTVEFLLEDRSE